MRALIFAMMVMLIAAYALIATNAWHLRQPDIDITARRGVTECRRAIDAMDNAVRDADGRLGREHAQLTERVKRNESNLDLLRRALRYVARTQEGRERLPSGIGAWMEE